ncbi:MAG: primase, partial [Solirubrobacteraceae bacterium]|nr:primase [Solirubrobacteraceae bacterium]
MSRYADDSKERVRDAVDMIDLVSAHTELRRAGPSSYQGLCPFHEERTPSFSVDPLKKVYHCFGCGVGGDVFKFVQEVDGVDFVGALELLADRYGVTLEREEEDPRAAERRRHRERLYELMGRAAEFYVRFLWESAEAGDARVYLTERGLDEQTLRAFRVGYAPSAFDRMLNASRRAGFSNREIYDAGMLQRAKGGGQVYDRFRSRIMFPLADQRGRVLGFGARALRDNQGAKYINTAEGEIYHKGRQLFGADQARAPAARAGSVIVVEGYTDVLALHQAGLTNAVGLMGTALTEEQVGELARLVGGADGRVVLALDADASGQDAMVRGAQLAAKRKLELRVVALPAGADPAELIQREGAEAISARVAESVPFARFRVESILDAGDLSSADGVDRALAQLPPVFATLPPSALREELVRLAAGRLSLSEQLVAKLASSAAAAEPGSERVAPRAALNRREQTERTFLALCIALPEPGREALRRVDLDQHFTSALTRRAAAHLREHLDAPLDGVPADDGELSALIAELAVRASREPAEPATLEVEALQLEKEGLEREIAVARAEGRVEVGELARERGKVRDRLEAAIDEATGARVK